jgi:hypothetical protein
MTEERMRHLLIATISTLLGCSAVQAVRLQPDTVDVGPGLRPVAAVQASASSFYLLFIPIPGVGLDKVVNQELIATAKAMGADKVTDLHFHIDPCHGFWCFWGFIGYREAYASGIAVQVVAPPPDPAADQGPEAPPAPAPLAPPAH